MAPEAVGEQWVVLQPGLRRMATPRGPWFQYADAVGFEWNIYEVMIHNLPPALHGLRIVQVADLHAWTYWQSAYDDVIARVRADEPDVILMTGDMIDDKKNPAPAIPIARRFINGLRAKLGIYAVRGNHDINVFPISFVGTPVKFIDGQRIVLEHGGAKLELIGIAGPEREDLSEHFVLSLPPKTEGVPRVIISHYPDHIRRLEQVAPIFIWRGIRMGGNAACPAGFHCCAMILCRRSYAGVCIGWHIAGLS